MAVGGKRQAQASQLRRACSLVRNSNWWRGSEATRPMTPAMVPKSCVGIAAASESGSFMTRLPARKRLTKSPTW